MKIKPAALLFDMDGTLTEARQRISEDVVQMLKAVSPSKNKYQPLNY
jgi:hydroxymethylpyrimidine pyrophosphatase-like HAD family hydrolase